MGKLKTKDWRYKSVVDSPLTISELQRKNQIRTATTLASYQYEAYKAARKTIAVDKAVKKATDELENQYTDWDLGCAAIILYRRYGFEPEEIAEFLTDIQDLTKEYIEEGKHHMDIWNDVRDEVGLDIEREY